MSQRSETLPQPYQSYVTWTLIGDGEAIAAGAALNIASANNHVFIGLPYLGPTAAEHGSALQNAGRPHFGGLQDTYFALL
ncbi:hypothetical protein, partial [uncultured Stenotrophomonas sp.]|uniref:hypothetical protein n=1 Tax=uncultured Stenotrophomonas sp. TaxID=165438 RepID=UPI0028047CCF